MVFVLVVNTFLLPRFVESIIASGNYRPLCFTSSSANFQRCMQSSWEPGAVCALGLPLNPGNLIITPALLQTLDPSAG